MALIKMNIARESNFEMLRLIAMFFIVWYHLLLKFIVVIDDTPIYKAMYLPLHVAVICFVLISGYFHIKPSLHGGSKLLFPLLLFYLPLTLFEIVQHKGGIESLLFFSKSPYWFIRVYFYLYLFAPILNSYLVSERRRISLLLILAFISFYMGWLMQDNSMTDGKNLVLFIFIYVLGDCLKYYHEKIDKVSTRNLVMIYLFLNIVLVLIYNSFAEGIIGEIVFKLSYPYCAPVLIMNACLLFLIFSRLHFFSRTVNWLAGSVLAVYVLHHQSFVLYVLIQPCVMYLYHENTSPIVLLIFLSFLAWTILFVGIIVDKIFSPLQNAYLNVVDRLANHLLTKMGCLL